MHRWSAIFIFWLFLTANACALSCMPPTAESVFTRHQNSTEGYVMAVGQISPTDPLPTFNPRTLQQDPSDRFRAIFDGRLAREQGFGPRVRFPISVQMQCFDDICGFLPIRRPAAMFLQKMDNGYMLHTDYCSSTLLPDPSDEELGKLITCLRQGSCFEPD